MMRAIVTLFWRICLFRDGPESIPVNGTLTSMIVILHALVHLLLFVGNEEPLTGLQLELIFLSLLTPVMLAILQFKGLLNRFQQAFTALLGTDLLISLIGAPFILLGYSGVLPTMFVSLVTLVLLIWDLSIKGAIFQRTFQVGPMLGVALALALVLSVYYIHSELFGRIEPASEATMSLPATE